MVNLLHQRAPQSSAFADCLRSFWGLPHNFATYTFGKGDLGASKVLRVAPEAWEVAAVVVVAPAIGDHAALDSAHGDYVLVEASGPGSVTGIR